MGRDFEIKSHEEMEKLLWAKVHELQRARKEAFKKHKAHREKMLPYMTELGKETSKGCADAAAIGDEIKVIIEVGQLLGIISKDEDYIDYL